MISNSDYVSEWKSKGLSDESIKSPTTYDNSLNPKLIYYLNSKIKVQFNGSILRQPKITYNHNNNDHTLKKCLIGAVNLTENTDFDKYGYSGYGIGSQNVKIWSKCINFWV